MSGHMESVVTVVVGTLMEQMREQIDQVRWNRWVYYVEQAACLVERTECLEEQIRVLGGTDKGVCVNGVVE